MCTCQWNEQHKIWSPNFATKFRNGVNMFSNRLKNVRYRFSVLSNINKHILPTKISLRRFIFRVMNSEFHLRGKTCNLPAEQKMCSEKIKVFCITQNKCVIQNTWPKRLYNAKIHVYKIHYKIHGPNFVYSNAHHARLMPTVE